MQFKPKHQLRDKGPSHWGGSWPKQPSDRKTMAEIKSDFQEITDMLAKSRAELEEADELLQSAKKSLKDAKFFRWW